MDGLKTFSHNIRIWVESYLKTYYLQVFYPLGIIYSDKKKGKRKGPEGPLKVLVFQPRLLQGFCQRRASPLPSLPV